MSDMQNFMQVRGESVERQRSNFIFMVALHGGCPYLSKGKLLESDSFQEAYSFSLSHSHIHFQALLRFLSLRALGP